MADVYWIFSNSGKIKARRQLTQINLSFNAFIFPQERPFY